MSRLRELLRQVRASQAVAEENAVREARHTPPGAPSPEYRRGQIEAYEEITELIGRELSREENAQ